MFDFFSRSKPIFEDYSFLGVDFHAHWLPGLDDGAPDMETTLVMLRKFETLGFTQLTASPHIMVDMYKNTGPGIRAKLREVQKSVGANGPALQLDAAAEYMLDEGFGPQLDQHGLLPIADKYVLVEFGFYAAPFNLTEIMFRILTAGFQPIIAHPERYRYYNKDSSVLRTLHDRGVKLQVNLLSLVGHYGKRAQELAEKLIEGGLVDYLGTDAHTPEHLDKLTELFHDRKAGNLLQAFSFKNKELLSA